MPLAHHVKCPGGFDFMFSPLSLAWPQFAAAAILLLVPLPLFFGKGVELRELDRSWQKLWMKAILLSWHWIDLGRVSAGVWLLKTAIGLSYRIEMSTGDTEMVLLTGHQELGLAASVLIVGMVMQTVVTRRAQGAFCVPFVYVLATTAVWFPPALAASTLVLAVTGSIACHSLSAFLWWVPVCLGAIGYWLSPNWLMLATGGVVSLGGAVLPILFQRESVFAHRAMPVDPELFQPLR